MSLDKDNTIAAEIIRKPASAWLTEQYLPFTFYAIRSRALVSDDGLKPVNRRIIWSMQQKGITHTAKHMKAARCAADAVAYHPHGSASVEDALARMAQGFSLRVPLIDPYGSVGIVQGDTAAAARYWEARLSKEAMELVKEVSEGAVELGKNFDGELDEPAVLPIRWPVGVINGTQGIAVGYASNMLSHNPDEVMNACRKLLANPDMKVKQLLKIVLGPDLPTGGELFGIDGVQEYFETGSGKFTVRGRYEVENLPRGKKRIIFFELPYQVAATDVIQKIHAMQSTGKFKEISAIKDLTDKKHGLRLAIETKTGVNHLTVLSELFKQTPLESSFSVNNTVLIDGSPVQVSMLDLLKNFIQFRKECTVNKAHHRIGKIDNRLHQLNAILAILIDIDKAIAIIRKAEDADAANAKLQKVFKIDEKQADYILSMQLRRLTKQDSISLKKEKKELEDEKRALKLILTNPDALNAAVDAALKETQKVISSPRRTIIANVTSEELKEQQKEMAKLATEEGENTACVVTRFANGKLLRNDSFGYKQNEKKLKHSPIVEQIIMETQDSIVIIGSDGVGRRIPLSYLSHNLGLTAKKAGISLPKGVNIVGFSRDFAKNGETGVAIATKNGLIKVSKPEYPKKDEFPVILLDDGDEVVDCRWLDAPLKDTWFTLVSSQGNSLTFPADSVRPSGAKAGGMKGMNLKDKGNSVIGFSWTPISPDVFIVSQGTQTLKVTPITDIPTKSKGGMGVALHNFGKKEAYLKQAFVGHDPVAALDDVNNAVPLPPATKRATKGVDLGFGLFLGSSQVRPQG